MTALAKDLPDATIPWVLVPAARLTLLHQISGVTTYNINILSAKVKGYHKGAFHTYISYLIKVRVDDFPSVQVRLVSIQRWVGGWWRQCQGNVSVCVQRIISCVWY